MHGFSYLVVERAVHVQLTYDLEFVHGEGLS